MNKQTAKQALMSNANACYNAVKENGWQSEMLKESIDNIVDEIEPDHPKVKLPREVGEELEDWLATDNIDDILDDLVCVYDVYHEAVRDWWDSTLGATYLIADMARYGWEAKNEILYNVKVPLVQAQDGLWFFISSDDKLDATFLQGLANKFTIEEIEHYGLQDCEKKEVTDDGMGC